MSKTKTPRNAESITKGALALPLPERVALRDALHESVTAEAKALLEQANKAQALINQKQTLTR